jgi:hypothetical protein
VIACLLYTQVHYLRNDKVLLMKGHKEPNPGLRTALRSPIRPFAQITPINDKNLCNLWMMAVPGLYGLYLASPLG